MSKALSLVLLRLEKNLGRKKKNKNGQRRGAHLIILWELPSFNLILAEAEVVTLSANPVTNPTHYYPQK